MIKPLIGHGYHVGLLLQPTVDKLGKLFLTSNPQNEPMTLNAAFRCFFFVELHIYSAEMRSDVALPLAHCLGHQNHAQ